MSSIVPVGNLGFWDPDNELEHNLEIASEIKTQPAIPDGFILVKQTVDGFNLLVCQLSTKFTKWIDISELRNKTFVEAFYDADATWSPPKELIP